MLILIISITLLLTSSILSLFYLVLYLILPQIFITNLLNLSLPFYLLLTLFFISSNANSIWNSSGFIAYPSISFLRGHNVVLTRSYFTSDSIKVIINGNTYKAVAVYNNPVEDEPRIREELKGKSGIYAWVNKVNGKAYVGSGKDLRIRITQYFAPSYLKNAG
jgi:hypothetical protein